MAPDHKPAETVSLRPSTSDLRAEPRRTAREIEVLVGWAHAPTMPHRYRAIETSAHGMRLRSMLPLLEGARGTVLSTIPHGAVQSGGFQVVWCRKIEIEADSGIAYEAGLRFGD